MWEQKQVWRWEEEGEAEAGEGCGSAEVGAEVCAEEGEEV
jgi:hypothetical protein